LDFTYKGELFAWAKVTKTGSPRIGNGKTTRETTENAWLATRGKGLPIVDHSVSQSFFSPRRAHSEKPDEVYDRLERLFGGDVRRIDLFAAENVLGGQLGVTKSSAASDSLWRHRLVRPHPLARKTATEPRRFLATLELPVTGWQAVARGARGRWRVLAKVPSLNP
jgi:hypothetical protein